MQTTLKQQAMDSATRLASKGISITRDGTAATAVIKSFDADGFTLTWTKAGSPTAGTIKITAICFR